MSTKTWKDVVFYIENILNNLNFLMRKFNIEVKQDVEGVIQCLKRLQEYYKEQESKNRGLHRLTDRILDSFSEIVKTCMQVVQTVEELYRKGELGKILQDFEQLDRTCAKCVRDLSSVDVLSLEIDECSEMRFWKDTYAKIREIVYHIIWLTYYLLYLITYLLYKHSQDGSEAIRTLLLTRAGVIGLIHRALFK